MQTQTKSISDIAKGQAAVIEINNEKAAVYRDEQGTIHAVSAICTHRGCTVGWNDLEKTWDCPCHGSRYDYNGNVINGPAPRNLASINVPKE
jgi:Rieske Fe-S protein